MRGKAIKPFSMLSFLSTLWAASNSIDCVDAVNFARGLNMHLVNPIRFNAINTDCCGPQAQTGIVCAGNRVTDYRWNQMNLNGTMNGTALPSELLQIILYSNKINGTIPSILPPKLRFLYVYSNRLTGTIPMNLPNTLDYFAVDNNKLVGSIPKLPSVIMNFYIGAAATISNQLYGEVILVKPLYVYINNNMITNFVIYDTSILAGCDISNNPLLGNPNIANLTMCTKNGLYSNTFTLPTATTTIFSSILVAVPTTTQKSSVASTITIPLTTVPGTTTPTTYQRPSTSATTFIGITTEYTPVTTTMTELESIESSLLELDSTVSESESLYSTIDLLMATPPTVSTTISSVQQSMSLRLNIRQTKSTSKTTFTTTIKSTQRLSSPKSIKSTSTVLVEYQTNFIAIQINLSIYAISRSLLSLLVLAYISVSLYNAKHGKKQPKSNIYSIEMSQQ